MDNKRLVKEEKENDQKGILLSVSLHILVLLAAYFMPAPPPIRDNSDTKIEVELPKDMSLGSTPALGLPDEGRGNDRPSPGRPDPNAGNSAPQKTETPKPTTPTPAPPPPPKPVISRPTPAKSEKPVVTTEDPNVVAIRKQQEENKRKADEERARQEYERRRQAEETARAAEEKRKYDEAKKKYENRFPGSNNSGGVNGNGNSSGTNGGGGDGTGRGNTGKPGNQGRPDGDPNSDNLRGSGSGSGNITGFGGRGATYKPSCKDDSPETGVVVVEAAIDPSGNVISARYIAVGSTAISPQAQAIAIACARQYKFQAGSGERVTGRIRINLINK
jgi:outer membrane biosynthesis protein TonB